jgi:hypothetical protein
MTFIDAASLTRMKTRIRISSLRTKDLLASASAVCRYQAGAKLTTLKLPCLRTGQRSFEVDRLQPRRPVFDSDPARL